MARQLRLADLLVVRDLVAVHAAVRLGDGLVELGRIGVDDAHSAAPLHQRVDRQVERIAVPQPRHRIVAAQMIELLQRRHLRLDTGGAPLKGVRDGLAVRFEEVEPVLMQYAIQIGSPFA